MIQANQTNKRKDKTMSHFYGVISESARKINPTARGHNSLTVNAQSYQGQIIVKLTREKENGQWVDYFQIWRKSHLGCGGPDVMLEQGRLDLKDRRELQNIA
jgi:hypothetical protein